MDRKSEFKNAADSSRGRANALPSQKRALSTLLQKMKNYDRSYYGMVKTYIEREIANNLPSNFSVNVSIKKLDFGNKCLLVSFHRYKSNSFINIIRSPVSYMNLRIDFDSHTSRIIKLYASDHKFYTSIMSMKHESYKFFKMSEDISFIYHKLDQITLKWIETGYAFLDA